MSPCNILSSIKIFNYWQLKLLSIHICPRWVTRHLPCTPSPIVLSPRLGIMSLNRLVLKPYFCWFHKVGNVCASANDPHDNNNNNNTYYVLNSNILCCNDYIIFIGHVGQPSLWLLHPATRNNIIIPSTNIKPYNTIYNLLQFSRFENLCVPLIYSPRTEKTNYNNIKQQRNKPKTGEVARLFIYLVRYI